MADTNPTPPPRRNMNGEDPRDPRQGRPRSYTGVVLMLLIVIVCFMVLQQELREKPAISFPEFMNHLLQGKVEKVTVERNKLEVAMKAGSSSSKTGFRVIVPERLVAENAMMLEEIGELGRSVVASQTSRFLKHLAAVAHDDKKPRDFFTMRRYIIRNDVKDTPKASDMLLVEMSTPFDGEPTPSDKRGNRRVYLLKPTVIADKDSGTEIALSFEDLLRATASDEENKALGLPPVDAITKTLPLSKGTLGFTEDSSMFESMLLSTLPWAILILIFWFLFFRQLRSNGIGGNVLSFGRSRARLANREKSNVTFADVAGIDEAKEEVAEVVEFLKHPARFTRLGGRIPRGILLVGPPGTGKTLLAKAIAGEADVPFFSICGSDFVEMFVGVGASRVRDLFKQARENSPCIVFLDEIDAVGRRRGAGLGGGHDEREQTLNAILVEMDGFETDTGIIVIAATNRADVLDPALLRPGRFDREIAVDPPDVKGREAILRVHGKKVKMHPSVDYSTIARGTPGFSGAELEAIVNEAAIIAVLRKKDHIYNEDLDEARDRVRWGRAKTSRIMDLADQKNTAYHEAGHTLVSYLLAPKSIPPHKVTIVPRGRTLGVTLMLPDKDQYGYSSAQAEAMIQVAFGGRIAEEIVFDQITTGAANDIKQATEIARHMVREWGMSPAVGPVHLSDDDEPVFLGRDFSRRATCSEATSELVDREVKRILDGGYDSAKKLVLENRAKLDLIAENLLRYEVLTREEIEGLMNGSSVETVRRHVGEKMKSMEPARDTSSGVLPTPDPAPGMNGPLAGETA